MPAIFTPKIARQVQDELQPLQVLIRIEPRVALCARGLQQAFALVEPQRLRMNLVHLGYRRDHVCALGFSFRYHGQFSVHSFRF